MEEGDRFDEEDDDLQAAILVEPAKHDGNNTAKSRSLEEVIGPYLITDEPKVDIIVYQRQLLMSVERVIRVPGFSYIAVPNIIFSGEDAQDDEGPRREFVRLLMKEVSTVMGVFESQTSYYLGLLRDDNTKRRDNHSWWPWHKFYE